MISERFYGIGEPLIQAGAGYPCTGSRISGFGKGIGMYGIPFLDASDRDSEGPSYT